MNERAKRAKEMTGDYELGLNKKSKYNNANGEVEGGEWIKNGGDTRVAVGDKHSKGGVEVLLEDGERILTDYDKIPKELAQVIYSELGLRVSTRDTYSSVLTKFNKKLGLDKITDDEEKLNKKLIKQEDPRMDKVTSALNIDALTKRLASLKEDKAPLLRERGKLFDILFEAQEMRKEDNETQSFQQGGEYRNRFGVNYPKVYAPNEDWNKQSSVFRGSSSYGNNMMQRTDDIMDFINSNHSSVYQPILGEGFSPERVREYQQGINSKYDRLLSNLGQVRGEDSQIYQDFKAQIENDKFLDEPNTIRSLDSKFGDFTSSRPSYSLPIIPEEYSQQLREDGIQNVGQLRANDKYADLVKQYADGYDDDWMIDYYPEQVPQSEPNRPELQPSEVDSSGREMIPQDLVESERGKNGLFDYFSNFYHLTPTQTNLKPSNLIPSLKTKNYLETIRSPRVTANRGIGEIRRASIGNQEALNSLDPQSRALAMLGLQGQTNQAITDLESRVEDTNANIANQDARYNLGARERFQHAENRSALDYEAKTLTGLANQDKSWRSYFGDKDRERIRKWSAINKINYGNAMNSDVKLINGRYVKKRGRIEGDIGTEIKRRQAGIGSAPTKTKR